MTELTTIYSITDEYGEKSTISIDKWAADVLQEELEDVHKWIQVKYELACKKFPDLSRRKRGDLIRSVAYKVALESPAWKDYLKTLFE